MLPKIVSFSKTRGAPVAQDIQNKVLERIVQCYETLGSTKGLPTVSFDLRGKTAGQAFINLNHIRLNGQLLNENVEHFIKQTVAHEYAHLFCYQTYGNAAKPHGSEWQVLMRRLGCDPNRCHSYDTTRSKIGAKKTSPKKVKKPTHPFALVIPTIRTKPSRPASDKLWAYALALSKKYNYLEPKAFKHDTTLLSRWVDAVLSQQSKNRLR